MKWPFQYRLGRIGADPEVFFVGADGNPVSVEGLLGGTKQAPLPMDGLAEGFAYQEDNVAAEFNIPPAKHAAEFAKHILTGLKYVEKQAKKHKCRILCESAQNFTLEQLATPQAQTLGCEPDFNVWTKALNTSPIPPRTLRTAAGHVHISYDKATPDASIELGRALDVFLGVPSVLVEPESERRNLYGKAGAIRFTPYGGLEYRVLGNYWLPNMSHSLHIFEMCTAAMSKLNNEQSFFSEELEFFSEEIQNTINYHNVDDAIRLMHQFNVPAFPER